MKHIVVATSLALSLSFGAAFAQQTAPATPDAAAPSQTAPAQEAGHHRHSPNPQKQAARLSKELNLTPDQTAKIEPILASRDQEQQALWQNQQLTPQDRHQQMRSINEQSEQQMSSVLSPDQMAQLKAMHHRGHRGGNGEAQPGQAPSA